MKLTFNQWAKLPETEEQKSAKLFERLKKETTKLCKKGYTEKVKLILNRMGLIKYSQLEGEPQALLDYGNFLAGLKHNPAISVQELKSIIDSKYAPAPYDAGGLIKFDNRTA